MSDLDREQIMEVARQAAVAAGGVLRRYYETGVQIRSKADATGGQHNLVSDADLESEQTIAGVIRAAYPDHELLGEEELSGAIEAEHLWVIDPLDGTNNFAHSIPHFAISIAYCYRGQPQVGIVYNPIREDWFTAIAGTGAWSNDRRLSVSSEESLGQAMLACGFHYDRGKLMQATLDAIGELFSQHQIHGIRRMGAAALDLCGVAAGQFGGFFEYFLSPWDFAAGKLIVEEAGGTVTTSRGEPLGLQAGGVIVTNGQLHPKLSEIVQRHQPSGF
ncbi:inositol monophosphatase family protein [Rosistilla oblonga]|uniref:inositol monophosphatase family protein n=1 Tax=Rosistilla oblonga TaxID=2527990 RepID=UPI003A979441